MRRAYKRWLKIAVFSCLFALLSGTVTSNANEITYTDDNVSLSTAIDKCIESGTDILLIEYEAHVYMGISKGYVEDFKRQLAEAEAEAEEAESDRQKNYDFFAGKAIVVASDYVNIRKSSGTDSDIVATILPQGIISVAEKGSTWTKIVSNGCEGYIKNDYLLFDNEAADYAMENVDDIQYTYNSIMAVPSEKKETETADNSANSGTTTSTTAAATTAAPAPAPTSSGSGVGADVANYALQFVGNPYVYGGTSLTNGADCSGFVMTLYKTYGYSIPRTADDQALAGIAVDAADIQPGDLIFYDYGTGVVQHVGMYVGNGQMVHAANTRLGIITQNAFYSTPIAIRRIAY